MKDVRELVNVKPLKWSSDSETESTSDHGHYVSQDLDEPSVWRAWWGEDDVDGDHDSMTKAQDAINDRFENYVYSLLEAR
ncbi:MAG: hypothetical protein ACRCWJ_14905 [Casimicrobium sp.]